MKVLNIITNVWYKELGELIADIRRAGDADKSMEITGTLPKISHFYPFLVFRIFENGKNGNFSIFPILNFFHFQFFPFCF